MTVINMSEQPDHPDFAKQAKATIGDRVKVMKITLTAGDHEDTRAVFLKALGKEFPIEDVSLWEPAQDGDPWWITYEIKVGKMDTIFLNNDEIEKV